MIKLDNIELTDLLPLNLKNKSENIALSFAFKETMKLLNERIELLYLYKNLDKQKEDILDLIATELRTQYYNKSLSKETKVKLIKNTLSWYQKLGTPSAVEELIKIAFGEGKIEEWFEYNGLPYHFKITTEQLLTQENMDLMINMIDRVKNKRSIIDGFNKHQKFGVKVTSGIGMVIYKHIKIGVSDSARA